jgi:hypothetical protein
VIARIKQKKELSGIDDSIVSNALLLYLNKRKLSLDNINERQIKLVIKDIRSELRNYAGRFQVGIKDRKALLEKEDITALLRTHSSTKERISFYPALARFIESLDIKSILDLGCGLNPIALAKPGIKYYASDINLEELNLINGFFAGNNIDGRAFFCDLNKIEKCDIPEAELCMILKVFDILGKNDYAIAHKVLERIRSRYILVSFSTRTLSGKPMRRPRRIWFENLIVKMAFLFEIFNSDNEIFYFMKRKS